MNATSYGMMALAMTLATATLWGCNDDEAEQQTTATQEQDQEGSERMHATGRGMMGELREGCPMVVQGADASVSDTGDGVALTFTTHEGDVGDLRARVEHMAEMYEMHQDHRGMMWHHMGDDDMGHGPGMGEGHMQGRGPMPAANATVREVDKGARLELQPTDKSDLDALREHARWHQQRMSSGECWMLEDQ